MASSGGHGLRNYILRRILLMMPTMIGVTLIVFFLCQLMPGGPIDQYRLQFFGGGGGEAGSGGSKVASTHDISETNLQSLKEYYGFDKPLHVRYASYVGNLSQGDLGRSFRYSMPVMELIGLRLPISIYYGLVTTVLTYLVCIPLGMVKAIRHKTWVDNATSLLIFIGYAIPGFALGAVLIVVFSVRLGWFPIGGFRSADYATLSTWQQAVDIARHSVLPLICYLIGSFAFMTMLMKNSLLENMSADFVRTALASGLSWRRAVFVHAARNSLIPIATTFGHNISLILTGSLLIEKVFNIQGMGLLFFEAMQARDYPVVMGIVVLGAGLLLVGNLLSDLCVALVDPRVRFG